MKNKKTKKTKQAKKVKLDIAGWNTSDANEIERRRFRGETEKFDVKNTEPKEVYFSSFFVSSGQDKKYGVEIRSLSDNVNSCDCPDYRSNALGTCKHIEHVLFRLEKLGKKKFYQKKLTGSSQVEIFLDPRNTPTIKISWPTKNALPQLRRQIDPFFSTNGNLLSDPVSAFTQLLTLINEKKLLEKNPLRISEHIRYFVEYQRRISQKKLSKETFLTDVKSGKQTLAITKLPLYPYQEEGMLHLIFNERALLADEMGLGKTIQAVAACEWLHRYKNVQCVLVVATASLKTEWEEQIAKFTGLPSLVIQGTRQERLRQYQQRSSFFYLTNYEQILMDAPDIQRILMPEVTILDEAQRIKNWQTKTANAVKQLATPYAFVLTGTPLENRIDDVYSIVQFLDPHIFGPLFRFNRDFYQLDEKGKPTGYKNLDEFHRRLRSIMLRRRKSDVEGELPKRTINNYFVGMDHEQQLRYEEYQSRVARLLAIAKRRPLIKEEMEKLQRWLSCMRMLCDTPYILDATCRVSPKLTELESILDELLTDETTKIIIFSEWERMLHLVRELAKQKQINFSWHTGSVPQRNRREEINRFKNDPDCRLFLSTDSGSVGLNLQVASVVINLDLPWNPAKLEQRIARAWRKHQTRPVQVINLICENSIEHRMLHVLAQKQTLAKATLEGEDNITTMKLPSGRAAFMERIEGLMSTSLQPTLKKREEVQPGPLPATPETVRDELLANFSSSIELLQTYHDQSTNQKTLVVVANQETKQIEQCVQKSMSSDHTMSLEMLDRTTFETIQRLVKAGIISFNKPLETLYHSPEWSETRRQQQEKKINQAKEKLQQASRKQRMAQVLMESDFREESLAPLREALEATLHSFAFLISEQEENGKILSHEFIKNNLINNHGLPEKALTLFSELDKNSSDKIGAHLTDYQIIFEHVDETLNKMMLS